MLPAHEEGGPFTAEHLKGRHGPFHFSHQILSFCHFCFACGNVHRQSVSLNSPATPGGAGVILCPFYTFYILALRHIEAEQDTHSGTVWLLPSWDSPTPAGCTAEFQFLWASSTSASLHNPIMKNASQLILYVSFLSVGSLPPSPHQSLSRCEKKWEGVHLGGTPQCSGRNEFLHPCRFASSHCDVPGHCLEFSASHQQLFGGRAQDGKLEQGSAQNIRDSLHLILALIALVLSYSYSAAEVFKHVFIYFPNSLVSHFCSPILQWIFFLFCLFLVLRLHLVVFRGHS